MGRRRFDRAFKLDAMKLVRERGVSAAQAARDLDVHENVLRKWVKKSPPETHPALRTAMPPARSRGASR